MTTLQYLGFCALEGAFGALCSAIAYQLGARNAERSAYKRGQVDEANWWIGAESEISAERIEIWRKEARL